MLTVLRSFTSFPNLSAFSPPRVCSDIPAASPQDTSRRSASQQQGPCPTPHLHSKFLDTTLLFSSGDTMHRTCPGSLISPHPSRLSGDGSHVHSAGPPEGCLMDPGTAVPTWTSLSQESRPRVRTFLHCSPPAPLLLPCKLQISPGSPVASLPGPSPKHPQIPNCHLSDLPLLCVTPAARQWAPSWAPLPPLPLTLRLLPPDAKETFLKTEI